MSFFKKCGGHCHWLVRASLAGIFIYHGILKFQDIAGSTGMLPWDAEWMTCLLATGEFVGGLFIVLGGFWKEWMTKLAGAIFCVVIIGAIYEVHWANGYNFMKGGYEFHLLILAVSFGFLCRGNTCK